MRRILIAGVAAVLAASPLAACNRTPTAAAADPGAASANLKAAKTWLAENGKKEGVTTTASGLQYKIVTAGPAGGVHPTAHDEVKVHYEGALTTGDVFDSSFERGVPATFRLDEVVPGWTEGIQLLKKGDEAMLYVPPELGYRDRTDVPIPPNSVLVFRVQLLDVLPASGPA